jgi:ribosomal protein S25
VIIVESTLLYGGYSSEIVQQKRKIREQFLKPMDVPFPYVPEIGLTIIELFNKEIIHTTHFSELVEQFLESPPGQDLINKKIEEAMVNMPQVMGESTEDVIIEELTKDEARERIINYFDENERDVYPSDLSEKLHINYDLVWEIVNELEEEGVIETGE